MKSFYSVEERPTIFSILRRVMPNIIAHDIVGVQPMQGPTPFGLIQAMRAKYKADDE